MAQEGYPKGWGKLTDQIKDESNGRCFFCDEPPPPSQPHTFQTHHLDHNRKNLDPENLPPACQRCHERFQRIKITMGKTKLMAELLKARENVHYQPHIF